MDKPYFCVPCQRPALVLREEYEGMLVETREWIDAGYELTQTNIDELVCRQVCYECGSELAND